MLHVIWTQTYNPEDVQSGELDNNEPRGPNGEDLYEGEKAKLWFNGDCIDHEEKQLLRCFKWVKHEALGG